MIEFCFRTFCAKTVNYPNQENKVKSNFKRLTWTQNQEQNYYFCRSITRIWMATFWVCTWCKEEFERVIEKYEYFNNTEKNDKADILHKIL